MICLPPELTDKFLQALKSGAIDPQTLSDMTSAERHNFLGTIVGEDNATDVNALFESKLLLKDQQAGMIKWAEEVGGMKPEVKRDILRKINSLTDALNPEDEKSFLHDLAAKKLGVDVTMEEAKKITDLAKAAQESRAVLSTAPMDKAKQIDYGNKLLDLSDYVDSVKPQPSPWTVSNIVNLPKTALTSILHFSAAFVQGWGMMTTGRFWEGFGQQFHYFFDPQAYRDLQAQIIAHPDYELAKSSKLGITHLGDQLSGREEAIQSSLLEHVPVLNKLVLASSRAFTGFLNYVRFNRFVDLLQAARLRGEDVTKGSSVVRDIAKTVNDFTGRGALGKGDRYSNIAPAANMVIFSPRKISATINMFDPTRYFDPRTSPTARIAALRQLSGSIIATATMLTLARVAGASVDLNPTSTNFLKIKVGKTSFDVTGGNAIYIRLLARIFTGKMTSATGKVTSLTSGKFAAPTRADQVLSFLRGKLSPTASALADFLYGKDPVGRPFKLSTELYNKFSPIVGQDFINMAKGDPTNVFGWLLSLSAIFGVQMETASTPTPQQ